MLKKLVLFDIDGTLITMGRPDPRKRRFIHFEAAIKTVYGVEYQYSGKEPFGMIDREIMTWALTESGVEKAHIAEKIDAAFMQLYISYEKEMQPDFHTRAIPAAVQLVKKLAGKVYLGLLTGNFEKIGRLKMDRIGLGGYFDFGVFGHLAENRIQLAQLVIPMAKKHFGITFKPSEIYIIGDTPRDVACGKAIGARTIAVTSPKLDKRTLEKTGADLVVKSLGDRRIIRYILFN